MIEKQVLFFRLSTPRTLFRTTDVFVDIFVRRSQQNVDIMLDSTPGGLPTAPVSVLEILLQRISVGIGENSQSDGDASPNDKKYNDIRGEEISFFTIIELLQFVLSIRHFFVFN